MSGLMASCTHPHRTPPCGLTCVHTAQSYCPAFTCMENLAPLSQSGLPSSCLAPHQSLLAAGSLAQRLCLGADVTPAGRVVRCEAESTLHTPGLTQRLGCAPCLSLLSQPPPPPPQTLPSPPTHALLGMQAPAKSTCPALPSLLAPKEVHHLPPFWKEPPL